MSSEYKNILSDSEKINKLLEQLDPRITTLGYEKVPRNVVRPEVLYDEIEELIQKIRVKFWLRSLKGTITHPKTYINHIGRSEAIDMARGHKQVSDLPLDDDGELYEGRVLAHSGNGTQDPLEEIVEREQFATCVTKIAREVMKLPARQREAVLCSLMEQLDDTLPLVEELRKYGVHIEEFHWPTEQKEELQLRASLSIARKKLRMMLSYKCEDSC